MRGNIRRVCFESGVKRKAGLVFLTVTTLYLRVYHHELGDDKRKIRFRSDEVLDTKRYTHLVLIL